MSQYFADDQWTRDTIRAWIGSLIDRAGSIIARPDTGRLTFVVSARDPMILHFIRDSYGAGDIDRHPRIDGLHVWRVKHPDDIRRILADVLPFLVNKADAARAALDRITAVLQRRAQRRRRDQLILAMREEGTTYAVIADTVGASQSVVAQVIARWRRDNDVTIRQRPGRRSARQ